MTDIPTVTTTTGGVVTAIVLALWLFKRLVERADDKVKAKREMKSEQVTQMEAARNRGDWREYFRVRRGRVRDKKKPV